MRASLYFSAISDGLLGFPILLLIILFATATHSSHMVKGWCGTKKNKYNNTTVMR